MLMVKVHGDFDLIALQYLGTDKFDGGSFSKQFRAETSGDMERIMARIENLFDVTSLNVIMIIILLILDIQSAAEREDEITLTTNNWSVDQMIEKLDEIEFIKSAIHDLQKQTKDLEDRYDE